MTKTTLYDGTNYAATIQLSDSLFNYDFIMLQSSIPSGGDIYIESNILAVEKLSIGQRIGNNDDGSFIWYTITNGTTLTRASGRTTDVITVYGFKIS